MLGLSASGGSSLRTWFRRALISARASLELWFRRSRTVIVLTPAVLELSM